MFKTKFAMVMTIGLCVFAILASCGVITPAKTEVPIKPVAQENYHIENSNVDVYVHQSMNETYNADYKIFGVETKTYGTYKVHYTCKGDSAQFIGNMEACMSFGFDLNEVIEWSNL